ncbi:unnamed protein product [Adineta ricciae]|uniref:Uncharacterized protein n=1 Tax=Adineta ricciae TaxID=249248 RepID=A0A814GMA8_ADIRI|nr:unnamed protein product [Adineta ricciae]CAF0998193.1 unnamed protein product [Adineta ricciae]
MSSSSVAKPDIVPVASYVAFAFIGSVVLIGLIARCFALNHSTMRGAYSHDLMIYQAAPKPAPAIKARRQSFEQTLDSSSDTRDGKSTSEDSIIPVRVQRGPKNL